MSKIRTLANVRGALGEELNDLVAGIDGYTVKRTPNVFGVIHEFLDSAGLSHPVISYATDLRAAIGAAERLSAKHGLKITTGINPPNECENGRYFAIVVGVTSSLINGQSITVTSDVSLAHALCVALVAANTYINAPSR